MGDNVTQVHLGRWLTDVPYYLDAIEIASEKARRFWWGQQIDLGLISWSMLLAVEGRRRNMPLLWAYLSLGHLVSLSFAQNLFFIALILTPIPLPVADGDTLPVSRYVNSLVPPFASPRDILIAVGTYGGRTQSFPQSQSTGSHTPSSTSSFSASTS